MWESIGYKPNPRKFGDLERDFFKGDYGELEFPYDKDFIAYTGAEYQQLPKFPNLTVLPNLQTIAKEIILGSTMGHQHINKKEIDKRLFQELYEFQGYGVMILRNTERTNLHLLKPGEKVFTGPQDAMTFYNLDSAPLKTVDYANPEINDASKDLEKEIGPLMLIRFNNGSATFQVNNSYFERNLLTPQITTPIQIRDTNLGENLYNKISECPEEFEKRGIQVIKGGNIPPELEKEFKPSVLELARTKNKTLLDKLEF